MIVFCYGEYTVTIHQSQQEYPTLLELVTMLNLCTYTCPYTDKREKVQSTNITGVDFSNNVHEHVEQSGQLWCTIEIDTPVHSTHCIIRMCMDIYK